MKDEVTFPIRKSSPFQHKRRFTPFMIIIYVKGKSVNTLKKAYYQTAAL